jgi:hypothetical protein
MWGVGCGGSEGVNGLELGANKPVFPPFSTPTVHSLSSRPLPLTRCTPTSSRVLVLSLVLVSSHRRRIRRGRWGSGGCLDGLVATLSASSWSVQVGSGPRSPPMSSSRLLQASQHADDQEPSPASAA